MSKDKIGALTRVAVGIKHEYHGIALDVLNRLNGADAAAWAKVYVAAHQQRLPASGMFHGDELVILARVGDVGSTNNSRLAIDYTIPLEQMIALGKYDWINSAITDRYFPLVGSGTAFVEYKIFRVDRTISHNDAARMIMDAGYRPAKIEHLLAFGAANPEDQREFPIVALGSAGRVRGARSTPYLSGGGLTRDLRLHSRPGLWLKCCRFLGVRNLAS